MAHFALLDEHNKVIFVTVARDEDEHRELEISAQTGQKYRRTSYNTHGGVHQLGGTAFRKNYAGIGYTYDETRDAFVPPQPYPSWTLNENTCLWEAPVLYPDDGSAYEWDEASVNWRLVA